MRLCSMWLCGKLLGGRSLTRAAFYQISTDSVLARSLSVSRTSCLVSLRPLIKILRISCYCMMLCKHTLCWVCPLSSRKRSFLVSSPDLDCGADFLATIWSLVEILRSLVVYVNHHNKDYLRQTPCNWLCGDDAAIVKLLWPLVCKQWCLLTELKRQCRFYLETRQMHLTIDVSALAAQFPRSQSSELWGLYRTRISHIDHLK